MVIPNPPPIPPSPFNPNNLNWARINRNDERAHDRHVQMLGYMFPGNAVILWELRNRIRERRWRRIFRGIFYGCAILLLLLIFMYVVAIMEKVNAVHTLMVYAAKNETIPEKIIKATTDLPLEGYKFRVLESCKYVLTMHVAPAMMRWYAAYIALNAAENVIGGAHPANY